MRKTKYHSGTSLWPCVKSPFRAARRKSQTWSKDCSREKRLSVWTQEMDRAGASWAMLISATFSRYDFKLKRVSLFLHHFCLIWRCHKTPRHWSKPCLHITRLKKMLWPSLALSFITIGELLRNMKKSFILLCPPSRQPRHWILLGLNQETSLLKWLSI